MTIATHHSIPPYAAIALSLTVQDWKKLGIDPITKNNTETGWTDDIEIIVDRITALLLIRIVAVSVCNTNNNKNKNKKNEDDDDDDDVDETEYENEDDSRRRTFTDYSTSTICRTALVQQRPWDYYSPELTERVLVQLRQYVYRIIAGYKDVPYHNREHAFHVVLSTNKMIDMMLTQPKGTTTKTFGLRNDPVRLLSLLFSALIHDVEHLGIPNRQMVVERTELAILYNDQSVAENRSIYIGFSELLRYDEYNELRSVMFGPDSLDGDTYRTFRTTAINLVLNTDIASPERMQLGKSKWKEAFGDPFETLERKLLKHQRDEKSKASKASISNSSMADSESPTPESSDNANGEDYYNDDDDDDDDEDDDEYNDDDDDDDDDDNDGVIVTRSTGQSSTIMSKLSSLSHNNNNNNYGNKKQILKPGEDYSYNAGGDDSTSPSEHYYNPNTSRATEIPCRSRTDGLHQFNNNNNNTNYTNNYNIQRGGIETCNDPTEFEESIHKEDPSVYYGYNDSGARINNTNTNTITIHRNDYNTTATTIATSATASTTSSSTITNNETNNLTNVFCRAKSNEEETKRSYEDDPCTRIWLEQSHEIVFSPDDDTERTETYRNEIEDDAKVQEIKWPSSSSNETLGTLHLPPPPPPPPQQLDSIIVASVTLAALPSSLSSSLNDEANFLIEDEISKRNYMVDDNLRSDGSTNEINETSLKNDCDCKDVSPTNISVIVQEPKFTSPTSRYGNRWTAKAGPTSMIDSTITSLPPKTGTLPSTSMKTYPLVTNNDTNNGGSIMTQPSQKAHRSGSMPNTRTRRGSGSMSSSKLDRMKDNPTFKRRMSTRNSAPSRLTFRQRLGIRRSMDLSGEALETYHKSNATACQSASAADILSDEPDELKMSVVLETIMTAADVAHNLQGWDQMVKWSGRLYLELRRAYVLGKSTTDPKQRWYENQIGFLESYLIPLARRLEDTGIFGKSDGPTFGMIVESSRNKWLMDGMEVTKKIIELGEQHYPTIMIGSSIRTIMTEQHPCNNNSSRKITTEKESESDSSARTTKLIGNISFMVILRSVLLVGVVVLAAYKFHVSNTTLIQVGDVLEPGTWRSRCGLYGLLPSTITACNNSHLYVRYDGTVVYYNSNLKLIGTIQGRTCNTPPQRRQGNHKDKKNSNNRQCLSGLHYRKNRKIYVGGQHVNKMILDRTSQPGESILDGWPFLEKPKLRIMKK